MLDNNNDNGQIHYFDQAGSRYPQFNQPDYQSGLYMSATFVDLLKELKDPRLFAVAGRTVSALENGLEEDDFNGYNGGKSTAPIEENLQLVDTKNISMVKGRYYQDPTTEPHTIFSYSELQFILAEAATRGWIAGDAEQFYLNGIKGNFDFYNQYAKNLKHYYTNETYQTYVEQPLVQYTGGDINSQLKQILTQKYLIMFHQSGKTIYYDFLRTGYPELKPQPGITAPTRWQYPITEYNRNQANLQEALNRQFNGSDDIRGISWWLK